jgi:hypothetical protein
VLECERDLDRLIKPTPSVQSLDEFEKMPPSAITEVV